MKRLIAPVFGILLSSQGFSQDVITLRNGTKYEVRLLEITDTELRFKMYNNLDGPLYIFNRSSFSSIVYENGVTETLALQTPEEPATVEINGYNTSTSEPASTDVTPSTGSANEYSGPTRQAVARPVASLGRVVGALLYTGLMAIDVAAKIEATKYTDRHAHSRYCSK